MIVAGLLLILVAVTMLVLGLASGSGAVLIGSIVASLLAAVGLVVGARQAAALRVGVEAAGDRAGRRTVTVPVQNATRGDAIPRSTGRRQPVGTPRAGTAEDGPGSMPDEPAAQPLPPADAALVALMGTDVLVIDGRPRYHLPGCPYLTGQDTEPLPVCEAVELGFTPCGRCEPDSALLADARRG